MQRNHPMTRVTFEIRLVNGDYVWGCITAQSRSYAESYMMAELSSAGRVRLFERQEPHDSFVVYAPIVMHRIVDVEQFYPEEEDNE
ncbi:MAG: hypothetical protein AMS18_00225 [Gemmatimonas sp. SG8_17]|nr:MAG: hypothetical protein AMS18_00225 [Gemmatimonas sp. SG8_17]